MYVIYIYVHRFGVTLQYKLLQVPAHELAQTRQKQTSKTTCPRTDNMLVFMFPQTDVSFLSTLSVGSHSHSSHAILQDTSQDLGNILHGGWQALLSCLALGVVDITLTWFARSGLIQTLEGGARCLSSGSSLVAGQEVRSSSLSSRPKFPELS